MASSIPETLAGVAWLNRPGQPFCYYVENASIIGRWMWEDQTVWPVTSVTQAVQEFRFIVTLNSDGSYTERTQETSTAMTVGRAPGGGVGLGFSKSGFSGNSSRKEFSWTPGQKGMQTEIDSTMLKQPLRDYLANQGWKKKGGLSKLFG